MGFMEQKAHVSVYGETGGPLAEEVVGGPRREGHPGGSGSFGSADGRSDGPGRQHTGGAKRMKGPSGD